MSNFKLTGQPFDLGEKPEENIFEGLFDQPLTRNEVDQAEEDYWNGIGKLKIFVTLVIPEDDIFEFEVLEMTGCVQGIEESVGIDYLLKDIWCIDKGREYPLLEGFSYTFHNISAHWTRGDGYTTDDNVDYHFDAITYEWKFWPWFKTWISAQWWKLIGWRFR